CRHDQVISDGPGKLWLNVWIRVGAGKYNRLRRHFLQLLGTPQVRTGQAQENIRAIDGLIQGPLIGLVSEHGLVLVQVIAICMNHAFTVQHVNIFWLHTGTDQQLAASDGGSTGAQANQSGSFNPLTLNFQGVQHARYRNDRRTVLIIMKNRNIALFNQNPLDFKALRRLDILQVNSPKGVSDSGYSVNKSLRTFRIHFNVKNIHAGKPLEQNPFALHNRFAGQGPQVAQTKNGGAIRDHRNQVAFV